METNMSPLLICLVAYGVVFAVLGFLVICIKCLKWVGIKGQSVSKQ